MLIFPHIFQHDSMECGITCLQMICKYYGMRCSSKDIGQFCHASKDGVSLYGISQAAKELGFENVCTKLTTDQLVRNNALPCILHWNQNHFVVLYKISRNGKKFHIADPGKGKISYSKEDFEKSWISYKSEDNKKCGFALFLEPDDCFDPKKYNSKEHHSFRFLYNYIRKYKKQFVIVAFCLVIMAILGGMLPYLTQAIVDKGIKSKDISIVWLILAGQMTLSLSSTLIDFVRRRILLTIGMKINISLVSDFFTKLLKLPMRFFDTKLNGDLLQRMKDHERVQDFLSTHLLNITFSLIIFVAYEIMLVYYNIFISLVFLAGCVFYFLWVTSFMSIRKALDYEVFDKEACNTATTYQFVNTMQEIKLQQCENRRKEEWTHIQNDIYHLKKRSLKYQQLQEAGGLFINEIKNLIITVLAATAVINDIMSLGEMMAVQFIIGQLNSPVSQFVNFIHNIQDVKISLERINEIQEKDEENFDKSENEITAGDISFNHVSFKYDPHGVVNTINDISICFPKGKITAIVGASGSGKTTILKLILGYYPVLDGDIKIGNKNINDLNLKKWREKCGVVMQEGVIFSESIERNIANTDAPIDREKLKYAAKMACVDEFIDRLPQKYNTKIGADGIGLSQGQKQRILIARAIYRNPDYIILDEATNSLDASNEHMIVDNLNSFYNGRTVIVVAHRLSTVKDADQIIVLDKGSIIEVGNHKELTNKKGAYYNLVKNQLELGM